MFESQPMLKPLSPFLKLLVLILIIVVVLLFTNMIGLLIALPFYDGSVMDIANLLSDYSNPAVINLLKFFQVLNQFGLFIIPVILFVLLTDRKFWNYLALNIKPFWSSLFLSGLILIFSIPFIGYLAELNQGLDLPDSWSVIENWMVKSEDQANDLMKVFLSTSSFGAYLFNMFMIALVAAVGEEVLFRGVLFRLFKEMTKNIHLTVLITAFFFSAFHLQFFGFLPRFILGIFLGYMLVWSRSLWVPIFAHFVYNGFAVTAMYMAMQGSIDTDYDSFGQSVPIPYVIVSVFLVGGLSYLFYRSTQNSKLKTQNT